MTAHKTRERDRKRTDPTTLSDVNFKALSLGDEIEKGDQFYDQVNSKWRVQENSTGDKLGYGHVPQWRRQIYSFIGGGSNDTIEVPDHYWSADGTDAITGPCPASSEGKEDGPPVGIEPRKIWREAILAKRIGDLLGAMQRYHAANTIIPAEWIQEIQEHTEDLSDTHALS